jgi:hypothetical protein
MQYTREAITTELVAALGDVDQADARLFAADALNDVTSRPGLRYAPTSAARSSYVVACDGHPIGQLWPGPGRHVIGGWTAAPFGSTERLGPFHTARAAAAALATACGLSPCHTLPG